MVKYWKNYKYIDTNVRIETYHSYGENTFYVTYPNVDFWQIFESIRSEYDDKVS